MASLFKESVELELLTDPDMLLMVEKGIRGGISHAIHRYAKANNKYMKNYDVNKESLFLEYLDANNLYDFEMSELLPVNGFEWMEDLPEIFYKKTMMKIVIKDIYLKQMLNTLKLYMVCLVIYHSYQKE